MKEYTRVPVSRINRNERGIAMAIQRGYELMKSRNIEDRKYAAELLEWAGKPFKCDQCEALMINGVFCHEIGCPNSGKKWIDGEWIAFYECFICGYDVRDGETCGCQEEAEDE